jgi:succinate dehydrogenase hydrophobic anchor subunit
VKHFFRNNGLSLTLFALFALTLLGHSIAGVRTYNEDQREHGQEAVSYPEYLISGAFIESVFENWESEFLQMGLYVLLTAYLFQKGSAESKDPDDPEEATNEDPREARDRPDVPGPVRQGGAILKLYENSLSLALLALFVVSFFLHAAGGAREYSEGQQTHGGEPVSLLTYLATARFWFESFQNWQSEFLSIAVIVVFSIFLRQRGSPESKPVAAPHAATGTQ